TAIRNRGTIGGSLAHADPAAELPAVAVCLDARLTLRGPKGERTLAAREFFRGYLTTALAPTELLTEVWFPSARPRRRARVDRVRAPARGLCARRRRRRGQPSKNAGASGVAHRDRRGRGARARGRCRATADRRAVVRGIDGGGV